MGKLNFEWRAHMPKILTMQCAQQWLMTRDLVGHGGINNGIASNMATTILQGYDLGRLTL